MNVTGGVRHLIMAARQVSRLTVKHSAVHMLHGPNGRAICIRLPVCTVYTQLNCAVAVETSGLNADFQCLCRELAPERSPNLEEGNRFEIPAAVSPPLICRTEADCFGMECSLKPDRRRLARDLDRGPPFLLSFRHSRRPFGLAPAGSGPCRFGV
jgi:hypothetical protein